MEINLLERFHAQVFDFYYSHEPVALYKETIFPKDNAIQQLKTLVWDQSMFNLLSETFNHKLEWYTHLNIGITPDVNTIMYLQSKDSYMFQNLLTSTAMKLKLQKLRFQELRLNIKHGRIPGVTTIMNFEDFNPHDIPLKDYYGASFLDYAAANGRKSILNTLLERLQKENIPCFPEPILTHKVRKERGFPNIYSMDTLLKGMTFLHIIAIMFGDTGWLVNLFNQLSNESIINIFPNSGYKAALLCILINDYEKFCEIIRKDPILIEKRDYADWTLLHWACCFLHAAAFIEQLTSSLKHLYPFAKAFAAFSGNIKALSILVNKDYQSFNDPKDTLYMNSLNLAAMRGQLECCVYLIEKYEKLNIDQVHSMQCSAEHSSNLVVCSTHAMLKRKEECVLYLNELQEKLESKKAIACNFSI